MVVSLRSNLIPSFPASSHLQQAEEAAATKTREAASDKAYRALIDGVSTKTETISTEIKEMKSGLVASMGVLQDKLTGDIKTLQDKVDGDVATSTKKLTADAKELTVSVDKIMECSASGGNMALVDGNCVPLTGTLETVDCDKNRVGSTMYNVKSALLQLCMKSGPSSSEDDPYAYEVIQLELPKGQTEGSPALNGQEIMNTNKNPKSGRWWIKPKGDKAAAQTYCDFDKFKGYCLASYAWIASTGCHPANRNMPPLNHPDGFNWTPQNREKRHGVIELSSGAMNMAKQATRYVQPYKGYYCLNITTNQPTFYH